MKFLCMEEDKILQMYPNMINCRLTSLNNDECLICKDGFFVSSGVCVNTCPSGEIPVKEYNKGIYCADTSLDNCALAVKKDGFKCIKCKSDSLPFIDKSTHILNASSRTAFTTNLISDEENPMLRTYYVKCALKSSISKLNNEVYSSGNEDEHCQLYYKNMAEANHYFCLKCVDYYTGNVNRDLYFLYNC